MTDSNSFLTDHEKRLARIERQLGIDSQDGDADACGDSTSAKPEKSKPQKLAEAIWRATIGQTVGEPPVESAPVEPEAELHTKLEAAERTVQNYADRVEAAEQLRDEARAERDAAVRERDELRATNAKLRDQSLHWENEYEKLVLETEPIRAELEKAMKVVEAARRSTPGDDCYQSIARALRELDEAKGEK